MTREDFISGAAFKFEETDSDSYSYDGASIVGDNSYAVSSVGDTHFTVDFDGEIQNILYSILVLS
jgi:hypothetical protein